MANITLMNPQELKNIGNYRKGVVRIINGASLLGYLAWLDKILSLKNHVK